MEDKKEKIFDTTLFKRLFQYIKPYKFVFFGVLIAVILLAIFSASIPYITKDAIGNNIGEKKEEGFLFYIMIMLVLLILQTVFQFLFIFDKIVDFCPDLG